MPTHLYPNGLGGLNGDSLVYESPIHVAGSVWYVDSATGTDAASPAGNNRSRPLATLAQAVENAASGDIIILLDGHAETITSTISVWKELVIVGEGQSSGKPTVKLTPNLDGAMITVTGSNSQLRNIWFEENLVSSSTARVTVTCAHVAIFRCYFEGNGNDTEGMLSLGTVSSYFRIEDTTFVSNGSSTSSRPATGIEFHNSVAKLELRNVTFDGGTYGFVDKVGYNDSSNNVAHVTAIGTNLLNGADMDVGTAIGYIAFDTLDGSSRVEWSATFYPNGIGGEGGDVLLTNKPILVAGDIWYVDNSNGGDAASPKGQNRSSPLWTLAQAVTNSAAGDIIVLKGPLFVNPITTTITVNKALTIVGEGNVGGKPEMTLVPNMAASSLMTISASDVELRNIWLEENQQANSAVRLNITGARSRISGCYIEGNQYDDAAIVSYGAAADYARIESTTMIATDQFSTQAPDKGVAFAGASYNLFELESCIINGGESGWGDNTDYYAITYSVAGTIRSSGCSFLFGSDMRMSTSTVGWISTPSTSGSVRIDRT